MLTVMFLSGALFCGCGGGIGSTSVSSRITTPSATVVAAPTISTTAALGGAVVVTLTSPTAGSTIYYTLDGSTPTASSQVYQAPFLVSSNMTVNAIAAATGDTTSSVASKAFAPGIASGTLIWSDEFANTGSAIAQPNPLVWAFESGNNGGWGNNELETYCPWGSNTAPCSSSSPNAYVGTDGSLHIVARNPSAGAYSSARMKTQGLFSVMYGRIEVRAKLPESHGMWPAFWLLGNNISTIDWPACGELDVMEHINGSNSPLYVGGPAPGYDWTQSSVHGTGFDGTKSGAPYHPSGFSGAAWHTYGMIWSKGQIQFYVDDPKNPYETFTPSTAQGGTWPFDHGPQFLLLNLAVGGGWPGNPDSTTVFPGEMLVDYVHVYAN